MRGSMNQLPARIQAMPRWSLHPQGESRAARCAAIIPFPGAAARGRRIVTYPATIGRASRRRHDAPDLPPAARRAARALIGLGLLLLVTLLRAN